ncbi:MAG TPA: tetratricopeptide repeat protein [Spirochaetota bacterium]|nr:tetratricopeptide repeat protein [Spirochaetota bacterium]HPI89681.1 tetratricopeptide repeat protein [Spirochaetota bacterium]HPR49493.1 tetratricopeptide repeat protein [Spirochaetota bacterium]
MAKRTRRPEIVIERNLIENTLMKARDVAREHRKVFLRAMLGFLALIVFAIALSVYIDSALTDNQVRFEKIFTKYRKAADSGDKEAIRDIVKELDDLAATSRIGFHHNTTYYLMGNIYFDDGQYKKAKKNLLTFVDKSSSGLFVQLAYVKAAVAAEEIGELDEALKIYTDFTQDNSESILTEQVLYNMGALYYKKKDVAGARDYYNRLISGYPQSSFARMAKKSLLLLGSAE